MGRAVVTPPHGPTPTSGGRITLDAWIKQRLATADLSDRTHSDDLDTWSRYSSPALRSTPLRDLSTAALEAYVAELREKVSEHTGRKLAPRTIQMFVSVVRAALNAAVRQRVIPANPARGVVVKGGWFFWASAPASSRWCLYGDALQEPGYFAFDYPEGPPKTRFTPEGWAL